MSSLSTVRPGYLAALDEPGEVLEVLPHLPLGVRDGVRHDLTGLATGRVGIVHRHLHAGAAGLYLLEADLAGGHNLALHRVPPDPTVRVHLGGPGLELDALAQGTLYPPVARVLSGHANLFHVLHEVGEVLEVGPVGEDIPHGRLYLYALVYTLCHCLPFSRLRASKPASLSTAACFPVIARTPEVACHATRGLVRISRMLGARRGSRAAPARPAVPRRPGRQR